MKSINLILMTLSAAVLVSVSASRVEALRTKTINLDLKLEKTGYEVLTIFHSDDSILHKFSFLDSVDNVWGIRPVEDFGYSIGQEYSLAATFGAEQVSDCFLGFRSCTRAFGTVGENSFSIFDGLAQTSFPDFSLTGGTGVGDKVILSTAEGTYYREFFDDGKSASWSSDAHVFTVVQNNLIPIPLPAGLPLLLAVVVGLGLMTWRKREAT